MATPREKHAVAVLDGKLYVAGGRGAGYDRLSSVERYDPATNAWEAVAPMATARRWIHRSGRVRRQTLCRRRIGYDRPQSPQLGGAVRPGDECVGGGGADGDSAGLPRHGNARRQAVRCWRVQRWLPQIGGAVRPGVGCVGGGGADGDGAVLSSRCFDVAPAMTLLCWKSIERRVSRPCSRAAAADLSDGRVAPRDSDSSRD